MSTYIIGDVHGCYDELMALLRKICFNCKEDRLIFVGDLINRGPDSLKVLQFVHDLGDAATVVLGNHDISLIAYSVGVYPGRGADFSQIMKAKDSDKLIDWLRHKKLIIKDKKLNIVLSHAGIPPRWSINRAVKQAHKAEKKLRGKNYKQYLKIAYRQGTDSWKSSFDKYDKFRYRLNGFSRLRYCDERGEPNYENNCSPGKQPSNLLPWFVSRKSRQKDGKTRLFFGHWASLGYYHSGNIICLDSGCVWGGSLTAVKVKKNNIKTIYVNAKREKR